MTDEETHKYNCEALKEALEKQEELNMVPDGVAYCSGENELRGEAEVLCMNTDRTRGFPDGTTWTMLMQKLFNLCMMAGENPRARYATYERELHLEVRADSDIGEEYRYKKFFLLKGFVGLSVPFIPGAGRLLHVKISKEEEQKTEQRPLGLPPILDPTIPPPPLDMQILQDS